MGDPQQKVGHLEWTEKVNEKKIPQNGVPPTQKMDLWTGLRWNTNFLDFWICGFLILWIFFFGQCPIGHPKHHLRRRGSPAILRHVAVKR